MGKTRPPYPAEFRREALSLMRSGARTPKELAADLGCTEQTLRNWLRQDEADRGERADVLTSDERARLRELERENRVLRQEREILKRAALGSARDGNTSVLLSGPGGRGDTGTAELHGRGAAGAMGEVEGRRVGERHCPGARSSARDDSLHAARPWRGCSA
jgi:transposase